ncbi:MAG TPA: amidohydrolase family protein [Pyrinomonadaceae bacterium]|nr:amidohydrolase family protein [Pyrinomonadaceae bacterium]
MLNFRRRHKAPASGRARRASLLLVLFLVVSCRPALAWQDAGVPAKAAAPAPLTYKFINGQWFDGKGFQRKTFYSSGGVLVEREPRKVDEAIDLQGGFVVPPFGDAHNHNIEKEYNLAKQIRAYLNDGIYYVKIPNSIHQFSKLIADKINNPASIDVVFANGGLTSSGGHPVRLYEDILSQNAYRGVAKGWFDGKAYYLIDNEADLQSKWPRIVADKPDFIKTYLLYSDEYEMRRADQSFYGRRGLDPRMLPLIVARAHKEGLRVTTHIETAADFHTALMAGVDEINHLPGHYLPTTQPAARFKVSEEDAKLAARRGVVVVTTTMVGKLREKDPARVKLMYEAQVQNLRLLHASGVQLAIGTDNYALTSLSEVMNLYEMKAFDNLTLLKLWSETTARAIFPKRKIGRLKKGYEASFLVLGGNPIDNFEHVKAIKIRFKQGHPVVPQSSTAAR